MSSGYKIRVCLTVRRFGNGRVPEKLIMSLVKLENRKSISGGGNQAQR